MLKDKYEISLWEDNISLDGSIEQTKLCIIGSDSMTAQWRALEPKLVENINGTNTFTFKIYYRYIDNETGLETKNPIIKLLVNERKIKVFWKDKWYHLIIKNIQENSSDCSFNITCKDQHINELSKNGFNLSFSNEERNGSGTIDELTERVLAGTDWIYDKESTPIIRQRTEEPVYEVTLNSDLVAIDPFNIDPTGFNAFVNIPSGSTILVYYSNTTEDRAQTDFYYSPNNYVTYENSMLVKDGGYYVSTSKLSLTNAQISTRYRAERFINKQLTEFNPLLERYVDRYTDSSQTKEKLGYQTTIFKTPTTTFNIIANSNYFTSTSGWSSNNEEEIIELKTFTVNDSINQEGKDPHSFIKMLSSSNYKNWGLRANAHNLPEGGLVKGQKYILRYKYVTEPSLDPVYGTNKVINAIDTIGLFEKSVFSNTIKLPDGDGWIWEEFTCLQNHSINEILAEKYVTLDQTINDKLYLNLTLNQDIWLETIELFEEFAYDEKDENGNLTGKQLILCPDDIYTETVIQKVWRYFDKQANKNITDKNDIIYELEALEPSADYVPIYSNSQDGNKFAEKIGSIEQKNSNRFNIIQKIAESFNCYAKFSYETEPNGAIKTKKVSYYEESNEDKGITFVYGIDLNSIQRTIASDSIVTKTIVPANGNAFGKNGFCTIQRADANLPKTNYILNFDYYLEHQLLDEAMVFNDLYNEGNDQFIGLYPKLNRNNKLYDAASEALSQLKNDKIHHESELETSRIYKIEAEDQYNVITSELYQLAGLIDDTSIDSKNALAVWIDDHSNQLEVVTRNNTRAQLLVQIKNYNDVIEKHEKALEKINEQIGDSGYQKIIDECLASNKELEDRFFNKYSTYIQEGSWTSEDYVDDNLFYYDALSVASTSARPQVQYNISVIRLSALEEFKNKVFHLAEVGYIQDNNFFGFDAKGNPIKEKIIISEITSNFDTPDKDSFKIQNFKTQFEDLFQRITAQTQSLQYSKSDYSRAASAITPQGTIDTDILLKSLVENKNIAYSSTNNAIDTNNTGITLTDQDNTSNQVKITSKGIIFTDNGADWSTGITAKGINAASVSAGTLNTEKIVIGNSGEPSFAWNEKGISAYAQEDLVSTFGMRAISTGLTKTNFNNFVRFNKFGLFGVKAEEGQDIESLIGSEEEIWENGSFGLTWKGFFLKNKDSGGSIEITSDKDIRIYKGADINNRIERVAIGRLGYGAYGIVIRDDQGNATFSTDTSGNLYITGVITAKQGGHIGGWTIGENELTFDKTTIYNNSEDQTVYYRELAGLCPLGKYANGKYYTLYIGRSESGLQSDASNFSIDKCRFKVTEEGILYATGADIEGTITAGKGEIGGWTIDESQLYGANTSNSTTYYTGMQSKGDVAFYAGTTNLSNLTNAKFYVKHDGTVTASKINITGSNSIINGGAQIKSGATIAGWSIDSNSIYNGSWGKNNAETTNTFMSRGTGNSYKIGGSNAISGWVFGAGGKFGVTKEGAVYASDVHLTGEITATSGEIGGWNIIKKTNTNKYLKADWSSEGNMMSGSIELTTNKVHIKAKMNATLQEIDAEATWLEIIQAAKAYSASSVENLTSN